MPLGVQGMHSDSKMLLIRASKLSSCHKDSSLQALVDLVFGWESSGSLCLEDNNRTWNWVASPISSLSIQTISFVLKSFGPSKIS